MRHAKRHVKFYMAGRYAARHVLCYVAMRVAATMRKTAWRPAPHGYVHVGYQTHHDVARGVAACYATIYPFTLRSATGRTLHGACRHDYNFQSSFLSAHNLFVLPLSNPSCYPLPLSTCEVPIGTCQVFMLQSGLRALKLNSLSLFGS